MENATAILPSVFRSFRPGRQLAAAALMAFIAFAVATHNATLAVLMLLVAAGLVFALFYRKVVPLAGVGRGALALVLGAFEWLSTLMLLINQREEEGQL